MPLTDWAAAPRQQDTPVGRRAPRQVRGRRAITEGTLWLIGLLALGLIYVFSWEWVPL
jgi:hypothetical protein